MTNTILPITSVAPSAVSSSSSDTRTSVTSTDFMKILLAQMSSPDLSSLFGGNNNENSSSVFGTSMDSLFGSNTSLLTQALSGQGSSALGPFTTPQMELSVWSNLIGKTVDSIDPVTGAKVSGTVQSVLLDNNSTVLDIGSTTIKPSTITKVS